MTSLCKGRGLMIQDYHVRASGPKSQSFGLGLMVSLLLISQGP